MSMTLTDRMPRGVYLLDDGPDKPGRHVPLVHLDDDCLKWLPLSASERLEVMLRVAAPRSTRASTSGGTSSATR